MRAYPQVKVAILGRPNVGKSTLFNRMTGTRHALVDDMPGVTRDRREGEAYMGDLPFTVIDTAGLEEAPEESLQGRMMAQTRNAMAEADILLLVVDARLGISPKDETFASMVRESGKPVLLLSNKAEGKRGGEAALEFFRLGLGEPIPISAEHGEGMGGLYDALREAMETLPESNDDAPENGEDAAATLSLAIVGRPNVGKSTLINHLLGQDRVLTGAEAGITRDSISIPFVWQDTPMQLVDTAGIRKRANVREKLEKLSVADTRRAIQYAHVCVLLLDATEPLTSQDKHIAAHIADEGRACVIGINKCDTLPAPEREELLAEMRYQMERAVPQLKGVPVLALSALKGKGTQQVMQAVRQIYEVWNTRISTAALNRFLDAQLAQHTPPLVKGRRLKIKYITQAKTRPPSFALFVNQKEFIPESYLRYLVNGMREEFGLPGVPIRLLLRKGANPYEGTKRA